MGAQNAIIEQSREEARGLSNPHGWDTGHVADGTTSCFRQVEPASGSPDYRKEALGTEGTTVLAHVRRATVGDPDPANTHPFRHGPVLLIHNGRVSAFEQGHSPPPRSAGRGAAPVRVRHHDSEHVFALLLQLHDEVPENADYRSTDPCLRTPHR